MSHSGCRDEKSHTLILVGPDAKVSRYTQTAVNASLFSDVVFVVFVFGLVCFLSKGHCQLYTEKWNNNMFILSYGQ